MAIAVQNIVHVNVNCTDIVRSKNFFETFFGFTVGSCMTADPQPGENMGVDGPVQWEGYGLQDAKGWAGTMVDLLEWKTPPTEPRPDSSLRRAGYAWLSIAVPDLTAVAQLATEWSLSFTTGDGGTAWLRNPDGLLIELRQGQVDRPALDSVAINCRDLARTQAWYTRMFGLTTAGPSVPLTLPAALARPRASVTLRVQRLVLPGRERDFGVQLIQPADSLNLAPSLATPNAQGMYRMAFAVENAAAGYEHLLALGADCPRPPCWLRFGPDVPVEGVWALFFRDPDGTCVELIQTPEF